MVEDDATLRSVIRLVLERDGYEVEEAPHGAAALAAMAGETPCAAVVDLKMPVMGGMELIDRMRADSRLAGVPVVLLSGFGDEIDAAKADVVLAKPFEPDRLIACVRSLVEQEA